MKTPIFILSLLLSGLFFLSFQQPLSAQNAFVIVEKPWKSNADLTSVISAEIKLKNQSLALQSLPYADRILFSAYNQVLNHLQTSINRSMPVGESLMAAYKKVIETSSSDPNIKGVSSSQLIDILMPLVELFSEIPQLAPQKGQ